MARLMLGMAVQYRPFEDSAWLDMAGKEARWTANDIRTMAHSTFRLEPKPVPVVPRCRELAREMFGAVVEYPKVIEYGERAVKEVLDEARAAVLSARATMAPTAAVFAKLRQRWLGGSPGQEAAK